MVVRLFRNQKAGVRFLVAALDKVRRMQDIVGNKPRSKDIGVREMDQTAKLVNALGSVLDNGQQIIDSRAKVLELEKRHQGFLTEAIRVMKSSGKNQILYKGKIFKLGTDPKEDTGNNDFLEVSTFAGHILVDKEGCE